ncbi:MAG: hypothetical protein NNA25_10510 [Nitrospira sp.]|nr:hypothetical protein [Nitrospira sp.]
MTLQDLIESCLIHLRAEEEQLVRSGPALFVVGQGCRLIRSIGELHLYEFTVPVDASLPVDVPVAVVPSDETEPTEGIVLSQNGRIVFVQMGETLGTPVSAVTLVPDVAGHLRALADRLENMIRCNSSYHLGPAERLVPLFQRREQGERWNPPESSVLTTLWHQDRSRRRQQLAQLVVELVRANKRVLLLSPDHPTADEVTGFVARAMKMAGLSHQTLISRYAQPLLTESGGMALEDLGFEAQIHRFYARSQSEKALLRKKYERFRELTPLMAFKTQKQKDLDEVRLLEWRLISQMRDLQAKVAEVETTLAEYETLPLFQRLAMQMVGKNRQSLDQYRLLYQRQMQALHKEIDIAQARIRELAPEAAVSRDVTQEYDELKETVTKLGGTKKVRELLAAEADPNRQAFLQHRRLVATTPGRVAGDPLFDRVRFDVLVADEVSRIAPLYLLAAAGLVRERLVLCGDPGALDMMTARGEPAGLLPVLRISPLLDEQVKNSG